jgi:hypothetical protein
MSLKMMWAPVLGMAMALVGCTGGSSRRVQIEDGAGEGQRAAQPSGGTTTTPVAEPPGEETQSGAADADSETASITLDEKDFASYAADQLKYEFKYLTYKSSGELKFAGGKATLTFKGLPADKSGTASLDILQGVEKKMHGETPNVTLVKGKNTPIKMTLTAVNGGGNGGAGGTGDLSVDISVNGGGSGGSSGGDTSGDDSSSGDDGASTGGSGTGTGTGVDPIAGWDGKSFKGNARWTIVPIE